MPDHFETELQARCIGSADSADALLRRPFATLSELVAAYAKERPHHVALQLAASTLTWSQLDELMDRIAATLQRAGIGRGDVVAFCAATSIEHIATYLGTVRAAGVAAPLPSTVVTADLAAMIEDSGAKMIFADRACAGRLDELPGLRPLPRVVFDGEREATAFHDWLVPRGSRPAPVAVSPDDPFNMIYSSGTTGTPKGIVHSHRMRWAHVKRSVPLRFDRSSRNVIPTPPYSNLTLVSLISTLARGATGVLQAEFEARAFLTLAQELRATHTMLVPVQYRRMLDLPDFDRFDLSSFELKVCAGAPCAPALKRELLERWPGELVDLYGATEGGTTCMLFAREHPEKLHTVGQPIEGCDVRILRDDGSEAGAGEIGEVVGHSEAMMTGYHNRDTQTREVEWHDPAGRRFIRSGDVGVFDADGFLVLKDRKRDLIISGGVNVFPSDLEAVLLRHPSVREAAVVGVPSHQWGETPVAFVVLRMDATDDAEEIRRWANARLGRTQRIAAVEITDGLPRGAIDKTVKRVLRERAAATYQSLQLDRGGGN